jgi:hypothetical protein
LGVLGICLLLAAVFTRSTPLPIPRVPVSAATLVQSAGAQFFDGSRLAPGDEFIVDEEYALTQGMVELKFADGAGVILEAPAVFEVESGERLRLKIGQCSVHAPDGAEGFRVETPSSRIIDLGTRFAVRVNEVGETDVQVVEGAAEVLSSRTADPLAVRLDEHQARRIGGATAPDPQPLPFDPQSYRRDLPDRVLSYAATAPDGRHVTDLVSIEVQRRGRTRNYRTDELIGVELVHFRSNASCYNIVTTPGFSGDWTETIDSDSALNTGIINPGGAREPLTGSPVLAAPGIPAEQTTPGMAIRFRQPVVNGPGPDVVFFELNSVVDAPDGDPFHVSPLEFAPGLRSLTVRKYDLTMASPQARPIAAFDQFRFEAPPGSLDELLSAPAERRHPPLGFRALATGIDLSDLSYPPGAQVGGLFIQDAFDDDHYVDPVFIAGLPALPATEDHP